MRWSTRGYGGQRRSPTFQAGNALLQHVGGRVHDAGVDVAQLAQRKEVGRMFRIAELVAGGLVNGHGAAAGGRVGRLAGVQLARVKTKRAVNAHGSIPCSCMLSCLFV